MTEQEQIRAAQNFSRDWNIRDDERNERNENSDTQAFWTTLLQKIFDVKNPFDIIKFNQSVKFKFGNRTHSGKCDAIIKHTNVLIEQKSFGINLDEKYPQSDGAILTPFEQAQRYVEGYNSKNSYEDRIKWVVVCNFSTFRIYDFRYENNLFFEMYPEFQLVKEFKLLQLYNNIEYLKFLVDPNDDAVKYEATLSKKSADIVSEIKEIFEPNYHEDEKEFLNKLCTRLVFLYYANDAKLIDNNLLMKYFENRKYTRDTLINLFAVLNQKENLRDENISDDLKSFPYVNGGLFAEDIYIPNFDSNADKKIRNVIKNAHKDSKIKNFAWKYINPTIFGSLFENILDDDERHTGGMHYTSPENIHKVIDPLFFGKLIEEFNSAKRAHKKNRHKRLRALQEKLSTLIFLDPACGSGNFLTETYLSLRRLENDIIYELHKGNFDFFDDDPIKVKINQFFGIEINNFAVQVAQVALWISENQMFQATESILGYKNSGLPLNKYNQIFNANALQVDWNDILPKDKFKDKQIFIIGNPPFVGARLMDAVKKAELNQIFAGFRNLGNLDYVCCWYKKAAGFIEGTNIRCAFVSTNSICQGDSVATLWKPLFEKIHFDFAYRTFKWISDSENMAAVHCVIIGFSATHNLTKKFIFDGDKKSEVKNISPYLNDGENIFIESRNDSICNVPEMNFGSMPNDDGKLIIEAKDYEDFIKNEPAAKKYIRPYIGADEFIKGKERYCLWLAGVPLDEIYKMPLVADRVEKVKNFRLASKRDATRKLSLKPYIFGEIRQPETDYILIPSTSSENRKYIPIGFMTPNVIASNAVHIIPGAEIYHFGILTSSVHMAWVKTVCGRLKSDYRYSKDIVYNNFVWCEPTAEQKAAICKTADKILKVRARYADKNLAYLYGEEMPEDLKQAHLENDAAVMAAYGFRADLTESEIVAELFKMYSAAV